MTRAKFFHNNRLLGALALTVLCATLLMAHLRGGVSMEVGEMLLHVQPHQEGGLMVSFMQAP